MKKQKFTHRAEGHEPRDLAGTSAYLIYKAIMKSIVEFPICQINLVWSCCVRFACNNNNQSSTFDFISNGFVLFVYAASYCCYPFNIRIISNDQLKKFCSLKIQNTLSSIHNLFNKSHLMLLSLTEQLTGSINHRNELLITLAIGTSFGNKSTSDEKSMYEFEIISKNPNSTSMNRTTNRSATWSRWISADGQQLRKKSRVNSISPCQYQMVNRKLICLFGMPSHSVNDAAFVKQWTKHDSIWCFSQY